MKKISFILVLISLVGCTSQGIPSGAVAWCGSFDYTGTFTKSETGGRALGLSDASIVSKLTVDQVIQLAEAMGCND